MGWQTESVVQLIAGNTIINPDGNFVYSAAPATGDLIASIAGAAGTDGFSNAFIAGIVSYASTNVWAQLQSGSLNFQAAAGQPVPATVTSAAAGAIAVSGGTAGVGDTVAELLLESAQANDGVHRLVELIGEQLLIPPTILVVVGGTLTIQNSVVITGTLSVNGSTNTDVANPANTSQNGLTNGQIAGTSGAASAGTAHTHGAGSYAVTNGQHTHTLSAHVHPL